MKNKITEMTETDLTMAETHIAVCSLMGKLERMIQTELDKEDCPERKWFETYKKNVKTIRMKFVIVGGDKNVVIKY